MSTQAPCAQTCLASQMPIAQGQGLWVKSWSKTFVARDGSAWKLKSLTETDHKVSQVFEREQAKHRPADARDSSGQQNQHRPADASENSEANITPSRERMIEALETAMADSPPE